MAKRQSEAVAAGLLSAWTDADTAMQIVGSSLGIFRDDALDPTVVLAGETPLRNALFDILLSLVEGRALDMQSIEGGRYAFRWRVDIATAGLSADDAATIDLHAPSPYLEELERVRAERDAAVARAELAEALAAERERLLRLAGEQGPSAALPKSRQLALDAGDEVSTFETRDETVLDVLYSARKKPAARKTAPRKPARPKATRAAKAPAASEPVPPPAAVEPEAATDPAPNTEVRYLKTAEPPVETDIDIREETVVSIADAEQAERDDARSKWSGYAIDAPRPHLSSVEGLGDVG